MAAESSPYSMQTLLAANDTAADLSSGCAGKQLAVVTGQRPINLVFAIFFNQCRIL